MSKSGYADQRFPLRRISRVTVSGDASWSTRALLACADAGINICFLNTDGMPRARWIGRTTTRETLAQRWQDFLDRPDWPDRYAEWRIALGRRAVRLCAWRMGWSATGDPRTMHSAIRDATRAIVGAAELSAIRRRLYGLAQSRATEELGKVGLSAGETSAAHLVPDLVLVIQWGLRPELIRWLGHRRVNRCSDTAESGFEPQTAAQFFERHSGVVEFHLRDTLSRLQRYLEELQ